MGFLVLKTGIQFRRQQSYESNNDRQKHVKYIPTTVDMFHLNSQIRLPGIDLFSDFLSSLLSAMSIFAFFSALYMIIPESR